MIILVFLIYSVHRIIWPIGCDGTQEQNMMTPSIYLLASEHHVTHYPRRLSIDQRYCLMRFPDNDRIEFESYKRIFAYFNNNVDLMTYHTPIEITYRPIRLALNM